MLRTLIKKFLSALPIELSYEIFYQFSKLLGIRGYLLDGKQGLYLGSVADRSIMRSYLIEKQWSPEIIAQLAEGLSEGGTYIDVGANIGLISLAVARLPGVTVIALEPDEENFAFLQANIAIHTKCNISAIKAAAWREPTELKFARNAYNSGDHHIQPDGEIVVRGLMLDSLDVKEGPVVIKIDTQGAEPAVLAGGTKLLMRADVAIIEFWPWGMLRMSQNPDEALALLAATGGGCLIDHGQFGEWMDTSALSEALREHTRTPEEYRSVDVMLSPTGKFSTRDGKLVKN